MLPITRRLIRELPIRDHDMIAMAWASADRLRTPRLAEVMGMLERAERKLAIELKAARLLNAAASGREE